MTANRDRHGEVAEILRRRLEELRLRDASPPFIARRSAPRETPCDEDPSGVMRLRDRLVGQHRGKPLHEVLGGRFVSGRDDLLEVVTSAGIRPVISHSRNETADALRRALWLLPGVREHTADRLVREGREALDELTDHIRFGADAKRLCRMLETGDVRRLLAWIESRAGRGHPLGLALSAFQDSSDLLFLDIETMGLFGGSPVIQVGLAIARGGEVDIRQLVAANPGAEAALVAEVGREMASHRGLVTFNGRAFDVPYLCGRAAYWGSPLTADPIHFDLLPFSRTAYRGKTTDCRLDTLGREVLGLARPIDIPSAWVPLFYQDYLADPVERAGLLAAIVTHNRHDMEQMVGLFGELVGVNRRGRL